jgi:hypothetical protein
MTVEPLRSPDDPRESCGLLMLQANSAKERKEIAALFRVLEDPDEREALFDMIREVAGRMREAKAEAAHATS